MTSPHPAQGSPGSSLTEPDVYDDDGYVDEPFFRPPPLAEEVFPAAMFTVARTTVDGMSLATASLPPGHPSGPMPVVTVGDTGVATAPPPPPPPPEPPRRRRGVVLIVCAAAVVLAGSGAAAYAFGHKTVTLDVAGEVSTVETFQGDVADLLADEGIEVTGRDAVTPGGDGALHDGGTVVVRYGHQVSLRVDGERRTAWVTALDADEALATLSEQEGDDMVLLPAISGGSATLPMRLETDAPVNLVVGGKVQRFADGTVTLDQLLADHDVRVDGDDRITVERGLPGRENGFTVTVVVQKVQTSIEETVSEIPFKTVTATDPNHYEDLGPYLATEGAVGKRVTSWDVITIDGKVVDKEKLNSWVAQAPVDEVIMYGSKARPAPEPKPKPKDESKSKADSKSDSKSDSKPDTKADPKPDPKKPDQKSEPKPPRGTDPGKD